MNDIKNRVLEFYRELPFREWSSSAQIAASIRDGIRHDRLPREGLTSLPCSEDAVLRAVAALPHTGVPSVVDLGCGTGIWVNQAVYHHGVSAIGVDMTDRAVARAVEVSSALGVADKARFQVEDLFRVSFPHTFAFVRSNGVLHHTADCRKAVSVAASLVAEGGYLHLGLYHAHGRRPLLERFQPYRDAIAAARNGDERAEIEERAFAAFKQMAAGLFPDEVLLRSWFRDQALHPHETQHTIAEVAQWLREEGLYPYVGVLPPFKAVLDLTDMLRFEREGYESLCRKDIDAGRFNPGFFVVMATRLCKPAF